MIEIVPSSIAHSPICADLGDDFKREVLVFKANCRSAVDFNKI